MYLRITPLFLCLFLYETGQAWAQTGASFTYLSGPNFCQALFGYTVPAFCSAPGEIPIGSFSIPPIGGFYLDPNFGAKVRPLTDGTTDSIHQYSAPSAFSATGKYALLAKMDGHTRVVDVANGNIVAADITTSVNYWAGLWSAADDDVLYGLGTTAGPTQIVKYHISTGQKTVLVDYATDGHHFTRITNGGTGDLSADNWAAFYAPSEHQVCAVDLNLIKTYCTDYTAPRPNNNVGWTFLDYVLITKGKEIDTNKRYVLLMATPAMGVFSVNESTGALDFELRGPEAPPGVQGGDTPGVGNKNGICDPGEHCLGNPHADVFADGGHQYLITDIAVDVPACEDDLASLQISKGLQMLTAVSSGGGRKPLFKLYSCGLTWSSMHVGCARSASASCVISIDTPEPNLPNQVRDGRSPFDSEVMVMRGNGVEVRRLAMHRSIQTGYWDTARAAISQDGGMVLWDSNFGHPSNHRVVVADTGFGTTPVCSYTMSSTSLLAGPAAVSGSIGVTPSSASCPPASASSNVAWATATASGNTVNWTISANSSSKSRNGSLTVAGESVAIMQSGSACSYALSSTSITVAALASSGSIAVSPTPSDCSLPAVISSVAWASASASGNTVNWSVAANTTTSARQGSLSIGTQSVSISQSQPPALSSLFCTTPSGGVSSCVVGLTAPALAPAGATIALSTSSAVATSVSTTTIPAGIVSTKFNVKFSKVLVQTKVTLTATYLGISKTFDLIVNP